MKRIEHGARPGIRPIALCLAAHRPGPPGHDEARLGIFYDVLPCESTILHLKFWDKAFDLLKEQAGHLSGDGRREQGLLGHAARGGRGAGEGHRPLRRHRDLRRQGHRLPALEVRPPGPRLPLRALRRGGRPNPLDLDPGPGAGAPPASAGRARSTTSSTRVSPTFRRSSSRACAPSNTSAQAAKSVHFSYEMVALSPEEPRASSATPLRTRKRNGPSSRSRAGRGSVSRPMTCSTGSRTRPGPRSRKGTRTSQRRRRRKIAREIATGALRYFMLKFARNSAHRLRFRGGLELRGRDGALPAVYGRPAGQHLPQAQGARRASPRPISSRRRTARP